MYILLEFSANNVGLTSRNESAMKHFLRQHILGWLCIGRFCHAIVICTHSLFVMPSNRSMCGASRDNVSSGVIARASHWRFDMPQGGGDSLPLLTTKAHLRDIDAVTVFRSVCV